MGVLFVAVVFKKADPKGSLFSSSTSSINYRSAWNNIKLIIKKHLHEKITGSPVPTVAICFPLLSSMDQLPIFYHCVPIHGSNFLGM